MLTDRGPRLAGAFAAGRGVAQDLRLEWAQAKGGMMSEDRNDVIRERAYALWERAGRAHGNDLAHWLQAEAELAVAMNGSGAAKPRKAVAPRRKLVAASDRVAAQ